MKPNTKSLREILDEYFTCGEGWDGNGKAAILQWVSEIVVGGDEPYREPEDLEKYKNSEAYRNQYDHHNEVQAGRRLLRAEQREILRKEGWLNE